MAEYEKKVRALLSEKGCAFHRRGKGDHDIRHSPLSKTYLTVDGNIKSRHTANARLKLAGIEYRFR